MKQETVLLNNEEGLHARAAATFVRASNKFTSEITLRAHGEEVNGKSIIGIMSLGAYSGEEVVISADGPDAEEAIRMLTKLVKDNFAEI